MTQQGSQFLLGQGEEESKRSIDRSRDCLFVCLREREMVKQGSRWERWSKTGDSAMRCKKLIKKGELDPTDGIAALKDQFEFLSNYSPSSLKGFFDNEAEKLDEATKGE